MSLNLVLMPGAKSNGHRGTWTGCTQGCSIFVFIRYLLLFKNFADLQYTRDMKKNFALAKILKCLKFENLLSTKFLQ